jgi:hypothetical protein
MYGDCHNVVLHDVQLATNLKPDAVDQKMTKWK